ncbi:hypothetical protein BN7_3712 [Wickerhamomyces ciferrii]|uniref:Uncharacterized protein n=1 Tax=Wickerhamomyces ciferrii (strain ATCC 14091 / BCRC 22168 / CBS 111 / JCM 3599 / NBRC 0793 / NRRL Y-1031 F-60-10) TaxID=1206466 RepID=K0KS43_WICCF|nr:uncharacterized protein BN7_3712 [Wickerhamomyces ciferrii]CCH44154.1 hypothetical protein BN7_3712 [Wickerhamomyces ciferrii]
MTIAPKGSVSNQERERVQLLMEKSIQKGREKLCSLTNDELVGTVCLVDCEKKSEFGGFLYSIQSSIFKAATFDPRTSFDFKKDEVFDIIEPKNVGYKRITLKLKVKDYPTLKNKQDVEDIRSFLKSSDSIVEIYIKEQLDISQVLDYLNKFGAPESDAQIGEEIAKVNRQRLPLFFLRYEWLRSIWFSLENPITLLKFYSNSLKDVKIDHFRLCFKAVQKQQSKFINYIGSENPDHNSIYFFTPDKTNDADDKNNENREQDKLSAAEIIENNDFIFQNTNLEYPRMFASTRDIYSVYDLSCSNNSLPTKDPNDQVPNRT